MSALNSVYHKYADEIKLAVGDYTAQMALTVDTIVSATATRAGTAGCTLSGLVVGSVTVGVLVSGGTPNPTPPPNLDDDNQDVITFTATTANGQVLVVPLTFIMRQTGAVSTLYTKVAAEVKDETFSFAVAVGLPYADPLVTYPAAPLVNQVSGPDGALVIGTPALVGVGTLAAAGVRVRLSAGTPGGVYVLRCLVYTFRNQRLRTNLQLTIT